jgi:CheY-like chemotaxis protein
MIPGRPAKILLIDSNVYFTKRLTDALKKEGFEVLSSTQPAFALTTLEYDAPTAVVCATNMREMGALEIAKIIHADPKNANLPIIALGDGSHRALMEAFQAGCEDYIDRQRPPAVIATHIRNIVISKAEGFQPTQMLAQADTSLSGNLSHHDLPGVLQMLGQAHQTGALHINAGATDALLFFDAGNITHAECGQLFGDEAVIHIIKSCIQSAGVYKFVYGTTSTQHTVLRNATDLMLDAMREYDESNRDAADNPVATLRENTSQDSTPPSSSPALSDRFSTTRMATQATADRHDVASRVLADLKFRPNSPVDAALADFLSNKPLAANDESMDLAPPAQSEPNLLTTFDPDASSREFATADQAETPPPAAESTQPETETPPPTSETHQPEAAHSPVSEHPVDRVLAELVQADRHSSAVDHEHSGAASPKHPTDFEVANHESTDQHSTDKELP